MAKNRKLKKKSKIPKTILSLLVIVVLVIIGYLIFNKLIVPVWERYTEKPVITKEVPYKEEEIKEVEPLPIEEMVEVNLYFSDSQAMYLIPEKRKISQIPSIVRQAVNELIKGPENSDFYRTIPEGTQVNEVYIADDIVYIDLSEEIFKNHPGGSSGELYQYAFA